MSNDSAESTTATGLTPEQRLEAPTTHLVDAGIATIHDMATLRACVAYENTNQQRVRILRRLAERAQEIRTEEE
ncbi:hypothetical protein [Halogranum rubrum]|uniref:DUF8129 domain-containing protein n=1 Tax=Halogranum salarium B-1 TaxID=1210908 RepID=J2Z8J8_9EURY|nr:hypothetical protein [Halogranum salarium]EJN56940.1 hypothetical protein HSB1_47570 [Halogranum salarium B-1]